MSATLTSISVIKLKAIMIVYKLGELINFRLDLIVDETRSISVNDTVVVCLVRTSRNDGLLNFVAKMPNRCISNSTVVQFFVELSFLAVTCVPFCKLLKLVT